MNLAERVERALAREVDPAVSAFAAELVGATNAKAVLFYGSNLRTGSLAGVLDFYVLTAGPAETGIWPSVSYREWEHEGRVLRAKIATMTRAKFLHAARGQSRDTTIWARFVQPAALVWTAASGEDDARPASAVAGLVEAAISTAACHAVALGPVSGVEADYWRALFRETYKAELRVEKPGREDSILALNPEHFDGLLAAALAAADVPFDTNGAVMTPHMPERRRAEIQGAWKRARRWGKALNIARLVRATRTFDGAARYAAWKIHRHTGVEVEVTPWRERHPILAAPGVLLRVWRARRGA